MILARDEAGILVEAAPNRIAWCPYCGERVRPRCGVIKVWHWSHEAERDCDPWWEPETDWHRSWKSHASLDRIEVVMGDHRADIVGRDNRVIELQASPISPEEIQARERHYGPMCWLINGEGFAGNFRVEVGNPLCTFTWANQRPSWLAARMPIFVHQFSVGNYLTSPYDQGTRLYRRWKEITRSSSIFQIKEWNRKRSSGRGRIIDVDLFIEKMIARSVAADPE